MENKSESPEINLNNDPNIELVWYKENFEPQNENGGQNISDSNELWFKIGLCLGSPLNRVFIFTENPQNFKRLQDGERSRIFPLAEIKQFNFDLALHPSSIFRDQNPISQFEN